MNKTDKKLTEKRTFKKVVKQFKGLHSGSRSSVCKYCGAVVPNSIQDFMAHRCPPNKLIKAGKKAERDRIVGIANAQIDKLGRVLKKTNPHKSRLDKEDWLMNRARQVELEWLVRKIT